MGLIPTYRIEDLGQLLAEANPSLVFDRYGDFWTRSTDNRIDRSPRENFMRDIVDRVRRDQNIVAMLNEVNQRRRELTASMGGRSFELCTVWRYTSGLGSAHPGETGFQWEPLLSVPRIPGSSIKGAFRSWLRDYAGKKDYANEILGDMHAGNVIILDALPTSPKVVEVDILNPHYKEYYENPEKNPPGDYYSPTPIFFLAVVPRAKFLFHLIPRRGVQIDLATVEKLMKEAFKEIGLGAKSTSGYGRFESVIQEPR